MWFERIYVAARRNLLRWLAVEVIKRLGDWQAGGLVEYTSQFKLSKRQSASCLVEKRDSQEFQMLQARPNGECLCVVS